VRPRRIPSAALPFASALASGARGTPLCQSAQCENNACQRPRYTCPPASTPSSASASGFAVPQKYFRERCGDSGNLRRARPSPMGGETPLPSIATAASTISKSRQKSSIAANPRRVTTSSRDVHQIFRRGRRSMLVVHWKSVEETQ